MEKRTCLSCGGILIGRSDKRYCSDQCRFIANYKVKQKTQKSILDTNRILRKNRSILHSLCPHGKTIVRKEVLESLGYNINFFTSLFITAEKQVYYLCYDYGWLPIIERGKEKALIVGRQDYMNGVDPWRRLRNR
jgi:predicted nucleic acid-binding Zn ribbon protein